jgi:hypothetical protein
MDPPHFGSRATNELRSALHEPHFELWNDSSLTPLYIALSGYNGLEPRELSLQLLRKYIDWRRDRGRSTEEIEAAIARIYDPERTTPPTITHHAEDRSNTRTVPIENCSLM